MKPPLKRKCEVILPILPEIWVKGSASYLSTWLSNTAVVVGNAQYGTRNKINCIEDLGELIDGRQQDV